MSKSSVLQNNSKEFVSFIKSYPRYSGLSMSKATMMLARDIKYGRLVEIERIKRKVKQL